jgi:hypothetical protein
VTGSRDSANWSYLCDSKQQQWQQEWQQWGELTGTDGVQGFSILDQTLCTKQAATHHLNSKRALLSSLSQSDQRPQAPDRALSTPKPQHTPQS